MKKVVVITGGSDMMGEALTRAMHAFNKQVVVVDHDKESGKKLASQLDGHFIHADLTKQRECKKVIEKTIDKFSRLDILINNVGVHYEKDIENHSIKRWNEMISLTLTAPFLLTKYAWPYMKKTGWGRIVNIVSIHGSIACSDVSPCVSAKNGLIGLTRTAAIEGGQYGITVNAICPAHVEIPSEKEKVKSLVGGNGHSQNHSTDSYTHSQYGKKQMVDPDEVADLAVYLSSEKARSITGAEFSIDLKKST